MKKITLSLTIISLSLAVFCQDGVQWRGENRDGKYQSTGLLKQWPEGGPEMLWHFDDLGEGHASVSVTENAVYTAGMIDETGYVFALDHNGSLLWKSKYGQEWADNWDGVRSTPLFNDGKLFILSSFGKLVCMDATDGTIVWSKDLFNDLDGRNIKWGITENLLIHGDNIICTPGGLDANIVAINKDSGEVVWKCKGNGEKSAYCSPQLISHNGRNIFVTQTESHIIGVDADKGKMLWKHYQPNQYFVHANTPLYQDGFLYCVSGYGKGCVKLQLSDKGDKVTEVWRNESLDNRMGGVILNNGRLYGAGDASRKWICLDWESGKELFSSNEFKKGVSIFAEGLLYWYTQGGMMVLVSPEENEFKIISSFEIPYGEKQHWAHHVIDNKKLYVRHGSSLMVYSISK